MGIYRLSVEEFKPLFKKFLIRLEGEALASIVAESWNQLAKEFEWEDLLKGTEDENEEIERLQATLDRQKDYEEHAHKLEVRWQKVKELRKVLDEKIFLSAHKFTALDSVADAVSDTVMEWYDAEIKKLEDRK